MRADDSKPEDVDGLYRRHGSEILGYLARRCPAGVAHDLLQEIFLQVMRQAHRLESVTMPRAWLFGIARNVLALHYRRQPEAAHEAPLPCPFSKESPSEDPRLPGMREAIGRLPPELRETLALRLDAELSYEEIAAVLGVPVGTVRSRLHHAVRRLRAALVQPPKPYEP